IYHTTEYRERRNHFAFYHASEPLVGFDTDRDAFLGLYAGAAEPRAVMAGRPGGSIASGWSPIASHPIDVPLAPRQARSIVFVPGHVENRDDDKWERPGVVNKTRARDIIPALAEPEPHLAALAAYWSDLLSHFQVKSGDERLDRMVNIWNPYQCMVTFN